MNRSIRLYGELVNKKLVPNSAPMAFLLNKQDYEALETLTGMKDICKTNIQSFDCIITLNADDESFMEMVDGNEYVMDNLIPVSKEPEADDEPDGPSSSAINRRKNR